MFSVLLVRNLASVKPLLLLLVVEILRWLEDITLLMRACLNVGNSSVRCVVSTDGLVLVVHGKLSDEL